MVLAGAYARLQAPVVIGGGVLAVVAVHEVALVWDLLRCWPGCPEQFGSAASVVSTGRPVRTSGVAPATPGATRPAATAPVPTSSVRRPNPRFVVMRVF